MFDIFNISESLLDAINSILVEGKGAKFNDEHALSKVWNHATEHPDSVKSKDHLKAEIEKAKTDKSNPLNFHNQNDDGFSGKKKTAEHEASYYSELHHAASAVHDMAHHDAFKEQFAAKEKASVSGATRTKVKDSWAQHGATNGTSKADIHIGKKPVSLKKGAAQLMSAGKEETTATYHHAMNNMVKRGHATTADHAEVMSHMKQVSVHLAAMKGATPEQKQHHKNAAQAIVNAIHTKHPKLAAHVAGEAATGAGKFGTENSTTGHAGVMVTTHPKGAHITDASQDHEKIFHNAPVPRISLPKEDGREGNTKVDHHFKA